MNKVIIFGSLVILILFGLGWWFLAGNQTQEATPAGSSALESVNEAFVIVAFGDSLTAGFGVPLQDAYPAQLEGMLTQAGYAVSVINSGVSGETTRGSLERATFIRSQAADLVILGIGGNDALRALSVDEAKANIIATVDILQSGENPPLVMLLQMQAPLNGGFAYKRSFDAMYKDIANDKDLILVPFITADLFLDRGNKLPDGVHYNAVGYHKVTQTHVLPAVEKVLQDTGS